MLTGLILIWLVSIGVGGMIGSARGNLAAGLRLSAFMGPLGVLLTCFSDLGESRRA